MYIVPRFSVLMASHLNVQKRVATLGRAIESIFSQSRKPHRICISYSFEEDINVDELDFLEDIISKKGIEPLILRQKDRKLQFEHYELILNSLKTDLTPNDWFIFLDDDDLFHPDRIDKIYTTILEKQTKKSAIKCAYAKIYYPESKCYRCYMNEYVRYAVLWTILEQFIERIKIDSELTSLLKKGTIDTVFHSYINFYEISDILYYQTLDYEITRKYR